MLQVALIKSHLSEDNKFVVMIIFYICSEIKVFPAVLSEEMFGWKTLKIPSKKNKIPQQFEQFNKCRKHVQLKSGTVVLAVIVEKGW